MPILDPPRPEYKRRRTTRHAAFSRIKTALKAAEVIPDEWINPLVIPFLKPMRLDQEDLGYCTGYATEYLQILLEELVLLGHRPTPEEFAKIQRDVKVKIGNQVATFDILPACARSAKFAYDRGRDVAYPHGNAPAEGGEVDACIQAWIRYGSIPESWCQTPKNSACEPSFYPKDEQVTRSEALRHCAEGIAQLDSFDEICEYLYTHRPEAGGPGACVIGTNLREDFQDLKMVTVLGEKIGLFSRGTAGSGGIAGGHALCIVGYSKILGILIVLSSWEKSDAAWLFLNGWTREHHQRNSDPAYVVLDAHEAEIAGQLYSTVTLNANVPVYFTINGEMHKSQPTVDQFEVGVPYTVRAIPLQPATVMEPYKEIIINRPEPTAWSWTAEFTRVTPPAPPAPPAPPSPPNPQPIPWDWRAWMKEMFERFSHLFHGGYRQDFRDD